ncbi:MAG TPA: hypothetical protein VIL78_06780 [Hanamia sp.]
MPAMQESYHSGINQFDLRNLLETGTEISSAEIQSIAEDHKKDIIEIFSEKPNRNLWLRQIIQTHTISSRLKNILTDKSFQVNYIEDITKEDILMCRNTGKKTWEEFVKLRGY